MVGGLLDNGELDGCDDGGMKLLGTANAVVGASSKLPSSRRGKPQGLIRQPVCTGNNATFDIATGFIQLHASSHFLDGTVTTKSPPSDRMEQVSPNKISSRAQLHGLTGARHL